MQDQLRTLFEITATLRETYHRGFPLDGRLVGDIGEALAKRDYYIELYPENNVVYDAYEIDTKRQIQIKSSMKYNFSFPHDHCPDYYIALHINEDSSLEEIYNGNGAIILNYIKENKLTAYKNSYYTLTKGVLKN
jgi:hypothetical protein